jgi:hypothetical protein
MNVRSMVRSLERNVHSHGYRAAMYDVLIRGANTFVIWKNLQCIVIVDPDPNCTAVVPPFRYVKLGRQRLLSYADKPEYELPGAFVSDALEKGDECHAILYGDDLASYGWYSLKPTLINDELRLHFNSSYVYMYKGFTLSSYRGQRLHAIGMTFALKQYRSMGFKGMVSCVETNNFDSLKSCYRMGYGPCGNIRFMKFAGRYLIRANAACRKYGLDLQPIADRQDIPKSCLQSAGEVPARK